MVGFDIKDNARNTALLLHYAGKKATVYSGPCPTEVTTRPYDEAKDALNKHFIPKRNTVHDVMEFRSLMQDATETFDEYYVRLRRKAAHCEFADENREVRSQINTGCRLHKIRLLIMENTSENGMPLEEVLTKVRAMELA
jgi:hypothetical protein